MKNRKGAGYLIESIVSVLVLLIFVAGSYSAVGDSYDWVGFEQKAAASDLTYTLKKTEHLDRFVENGETGAIRGVSSSLLNRRMTPAGSVKGLPTGSYQVGVYIDSDGSDTETDTSLQEVTSGDRCSGDLEEIQPDDGDIVRTGAGGYVESTHGIRLYFADADPGTSGTEDLDYDSVWVDNGSTCQFTRDEGPYRLNDFITLEDTTYKFNRIESPGEPDFAVFQKSELSHELSQDFKQFESGEIDVRRFNFSSQLNNYDVLIFKDQNNLDDINSNEAELLDYMRDGKAIFAMSLQQSDLNSGFLSETGLKWIDLPVNTVSEDEMFGDGERGRKAESYFNQLGFTTSEVSISPDGKIGSGMEYYARETQILASSAHTYDRTLWDAENESMVDENNPPAGTPSSDCSDAYRKGNFTFPSGVSGSEELRAYNVKLSGTGCTDFQFGVAIDKKGDGSGNPDGDVRDEGEGVHLNNGFVKINGRLYEVEINAHEEVRFDYVGDERTEIISYVNDLETQSSEGFARFPSIEGSDSQEYIGVLSSLTFMMLEDERGFGPERSSSTTTSAAGKTDDGDVFSVNLRWID